MLLTVTFWGQEIKENNTQTVLDSIKAKYVPDRRVNVYDISLVGEGKTTTIEGFISEPSAYQELKSYIKLNGYTDKVRFLPLKKELEGKTYGVINLSVGDIREKPDFTAGMATQAILGTPIRVLQKDGWYRIQTPDGYIGWSQSANFHPMTKDEFNSWISSEKIIFTDYFGFAYKYPNLNEQTLGDMVMGNILKFEGEEGEFYKAAYPDGRITYILKRQAKLYKEWLGSINLTGDNLIKKSFTLMGIPYVWGGTSIKGMDCSGFTKTILFMHGVILMRDASQQVNTGIPVDISNGYRNLKVGDLMFFGKRDDKLKRDRIRHVGFYIGNNEFIHASGKIRVSSLDPNQPHYDEVNTKEFIRASRIIGAVDTEGIWSIDKNPFYNMQ